VRLKNCRSNRPSTQCATLGNASAARTQSTASMMALAGLLGICLILPGCGSNSAPVQVGPIAFTDSDGNQVGGRQTTLTAGDTTYVDVALTGNAAALGVDWTVDCGSAPPPGTPLPPGELEDDSCGYFTPVHTLSGPVPTYATSGAGYVTVFTAPAAPPKTGVVTLFAAATGDHSRYSTVTLTILGLPISIQFAPPPPSSLPVSGSTLLKAVLTNDYASAGVTWTVACGSSDCGSFSAAQTASGVAATYTAPASEPTNGSVVVTAASVTDPTKTLSATISILPVAVSIAAASPSVYVDGTDLLTATVANDVANAGVDWTLSCGTAGACGSIDGHTASGVAATYTAPATAPASGSVQVTAASTSVPAATAMTTITIGAAPAVVAGIVRAGQAPVVGATVSLYAAGETGYGSSSTLLNASKIHMSLTDDEGGFRVTADTNCPNPDSQLYLIAQGGNAGAGANANLVLMAPLGSCGANRVRSGVTVNEVSTVGSAYFLAAFMQDATHVGTIRSNRIGLANAFAAISNVVDLASGEARAITPAGNGAVPQSTIDALANILNRCAATGGGSAGDGSACGDLFTLTRSSSSANTLQAVLSIAWQSGNARVDEALDRLSAAIGANGPFTPTLLTSPANWQIALTFTSPAITNPRAIYVGSLGNVWVGNGAACVELNAAGAEIPGTPAASVLCGLTAQPGNDLPVTAVDGSGNRWTLRSDENSVTEIVGDATPASDSCAQAGARP
jgi:hypothetical protein